MKSLLITSILVPSVCTGFVPTQIKKNTVENSSHVVGNQPVIREGEIYTLVETRAIAQAIATKNKKRDEKKEEKYHFLDWSKFGLKENEVAHIDLNKSYFYAEMSWGYMTNSPEDPGDHHFSLNQKVSFTIKNMNLAWKNESRDEGCFQYHDWYWGYRFGITNEGVSLQTRAWAFAEEDGNPRPRSTIATNSIDELFYHIVLN